MLNFFGTGAGFVALRLSAKGIMRKQTCSKALTAAELDFEAPDAGSRMIIVRFAYNNGVPGTRRRLERNSLSCVATKKRFVLLRPARTS